MIERLTESKKAELIEFIEERRLGGIAAGPADVDAARAPLDKMYASVKHRLGEVIRLHAPFEAYNPGTSTMRLSLEDNINKLNLLLGRQLGEEAKSEIDGLMRRRLSPQFVQCMAIQSHFSHARWWAGCCNSHIVLLNCYLRAGCELFGRDLDRMAWLTELSKHCLFWSPSRMDVFICDHPVSKWDGNDRLHCEDGPAVSFSNGNDFYYWHGVFVPERIIIAPESQSLEEIHDERNVELRRIRIERYGWQRYLRASATRLIDSRRNEVEGTSEALMDSPSSKVLVCSCPSTARLYALEVPRDIQTCEQAQAWLSGGLSKRVTTAT